jgi:bifunctional non-homologous end joining protein LigD
MKHPSSLEEYQAKRDFSRTPEPRGGRTADPGKQSFVVQRHDARHLHFDFRLELDGVLKSWAVPKGISADPAIRRLAIQVEDHPLSYASFEGTIPAGAYGAGTVQIWDRGQWVPEGDVHRALERGKLLFTLKGKRLRGRWSLIRFRSQSEREGKEYWLLRKLPLSASSGGRRTSTIDRLPRSLSRGRPARRRSSPLRSPLPEGLEPELATRVGQAPSGEDWIHEVKFDGYRFLTTIEDGKVHMWTRNHRDWAPHFPRLVRELVALKTRSAVLDGEVLALRADGKSDFGLLKEVLSTGAEGVLFYYLFDLLHLDGTDYRSLPLLERKAALSDLLAGSRGSPHLRYSDHVRGNGDLFYRQACKMMLEGIVSKRVDSPYRPGRARDWLKVKCHEQQEFVIGGFTEPQGARAGLGALLLGLYQGGELLYAGRVGTGFSKSALEDLRHRLESSERRTSPFKGDLPSRDRRGVHWTDPSLVAEVAFANWTSDHRLRQPVFLGLREDKPAEDVVREHAKPVSAGTETLTHPDRILFPEEGLTKRDLAEYYESLAPWILPHVRDRLLSIVRCPEGISGSCFYQKHPIPSMPASIHATPFQEKNEPSTGIRIEDAAGLAALVQLGTIEVHPWASRVSDLEHPDRCFFDLDPGPEAPWKDVVRAARALERYLETLGLESFLKTTGGKGLHVMVPFTDSPDWTALRTFSRKVAEEMARRDPDRLTVSLPKAGRKGRLFIDTLRNERGATAVAPYTVRTHPRATVATPIGWKELSASLHPDQFTIRTIPRRVSRLSVDPWERLASVRQGIPSSF